MSKFLEKHKPLNEEEVKKRFAESARAKEKYSHDMSVIEQNLMGFIDDEEPLIDPETDKELCWMRAPTMMELESVGEIYKGTDVTNITAEDREKYIQSQYILMAEIITQPKHDAQWWKEHTNIKFLTLFRLKIEQMFNALGVAIENFPNPQQE